MNDFDNKILNLMLEIGFKFVNTTRTEDGMFHNYKYYPEYLQNKHYTFVLFVYRHYASCDHRLYVHRNDTGTFIESIFQQSNFSNLNRIIIRDCINDKFVSELRVITIKNIIK